MYQSTPEEKEKAILREHILNTYNKQYADVSTLKKKTQTTTKQQSQSLNLKISTI
jgi:hypothetical protein